MLTTHMAVRQEEDGRVQFLTPDACAAWCERNGYNVRGHPRRPRLPEDVFRKRRLVMPPETAERVALARDVWAVVHEPRAETLVWLTAWGMDPEGEHVPLMDLARRGLGERRWLTEVPGALVGPGDSEDGLSLFVVAVLFLWDCWVLGARGRAASLVSHEGYAMVWEPMA